MAPVGTVRLKPSLPDLQFNAFYGPRRPRFHFSTATLRKQTVTYYSLQSESMARAKAGINAPLTQFQPVVPSNQAEQEAVLLTLPFTTVHLRNAAVLLRKTGR